MARRDSSSDSLDSRSSSSPRTTTLDSLEPTGGAGVTGTSGAGNLGSSGLSGASSTGGSSPTNWQRAGQESQTAGHNPVAQVKEEAKGLASEAKQEALGVVGQARDHVQGLVEERKDRAADQLGSFAGSLRDAARKLEDGDGGATALGRYAQTAADQVDRVSQYLRDRDLRAFVRDAETFARRHPDVFLGGTFVAGLVLARFFKASERRNQDELAEDWQAAGYAGSTGAYGSSSRNTSYGNTYNPRTSPSSGSTSGSTYGGERSENAWSPGGPVPPVGG